MPEASRQRQSDQAPEQASARAGDAAPGADVVPALAQRVLALQQGAGNAAVSRWLRTIPARSLAREGEAAPPGSPAPAAPPKPRVSYVFLMGDFKNDNFYLAAKEYFAHEVPKAIMVTDKRTLADVIAHVNAGGSPVDTLYIVSHANETGNLGFSLDASDAAKDKSTGDGKPRTEFGEVKAANAQGTLPKADVALIDGQTKVQIKGCNVGRSQLMLEQLDEAFGGKASVTAPTHTQEYRFHGDGKGAVVYEENFAELFIEEPGIASKDAAALGVAFRAKYPMVPEPKWKGLLAKVKKEDKTKTMFRWDGLDPPADDEKSVLGRIHAATKWPKAAGWVVTYKGRETVGGKWQFNVEAERVLKDGSTEKETSFIQVQIPPAEADLIANAKASHGRPDAYTWRLKRTPSGEKLALEVIAERTEWVIDGTIQDASGPFHPAQSDKDWYKTSTFAPPPAPTP